MRGIHDTVAWFRCHAALLLLCAMMIVIHGMILHDHLLYPKQSERSTIQTTATAVYLSVHASCPLACNLFSSFFSPVYFLAFFLSFFFVLALDYLSPDEPLGACSIKLAEIPRTGLFSSAVWIRVFGSHFVVVSVFHHIFFLVSVSCFVSIHLHSHLSVLIFCVSLPHFPSFFPFLSTFSTFLLCFS